MKQPATLILAVTLSFGLAGPGHADDGKTGGVADGCRSITGEEAERMSAELRNMDRDELVRLTREAGEAEGMKFADLSEAEKEKFRAQWHEAAVKSPLVLRTFCEYFTRGALPGVGADVGHGSLMLYREAFTLPAEAGSGEQDVADPEPGADDCEKPYQVDLELSGRATRHIFCETGGKFTLTSSHRPDGAGGWTKIE